MTPRHSSRSHDPGYSRRAFTLVEMLVAITIFVILSTLAFGAFSVVSEGDRGPAASRSFRAWVEGAKSRAAKLGRPVGIQPFIDPNEFNGHAVSQFQYVANVEPITGFLNPLRSTPVDGYQEAGFRLSAGLAWDTTSQVWEVFQSPFDAVPWSLIDGLDPTGAPDLREPAIIQPGNRIEITINDEPNWYYIAAVDFGTGTGEFNPSFEPTAGAPQNSFYIVGDIPGQKWMFDPDLSTAPNPPNRFVIPQIPAPGSTVTVNVALPYRIELGPDLLEGERLLRLPGSMFVDLDASTTPPSGFPDDATLGDGDGSGWNDQYQPVPLMFSPTGEVIGAYQSLGPITFYFANRDELTTSRARINHPTNSAGNYNDWIMPPVSRSFPYVSAEPVGDPQVLTIFPKTGFIQKSIVFPVDADTANPDGTGAAGTPDGFSDDPYRLRLRGEFDE